MGFDVRWRSVNKTNYHGEITSVVVVYTTYSYSSIAHAVPGFGQSVALDSASNPRNDPPTPKFSLIVVQRRAAGVNPNDL